MADVKMRKGKDHVWQADATWRLHEVATKGLMIVMGLSLAALVMVVYRHQLRPDGPLRREYVGKIVDKSLTVRETKLGSKMVGRLLVEGEGGKRFEVAPGLDVYERAQTGMWIKGSQAGVELSWSEPIKGLPSKAKGTSDNE
ncbi:MAG: hypothetical protein ABR554_07760 [Pyrinomonadaceae bacterium]